MESVSETPAKHFVDFVYLDKATAAKNRLKYSDDVTIL